MNLLFSKPDALGDQLIAAGPLQALRRLRPDCRIVWHLRAGMEAIAPLLGATVFVPQRDRAPEAEAARLAADTSPLILLPYPLSAFEPWTEELRPRIAWWVAFLRATRWDATALGLVNRTWVGDLTAAVAPAPVRIGFAASAARQPLVNDAQALAGADAPAFTQALPPSFDRAEAEQLRDLLALLEPRLRDGAPPLWAPATPWQRPAPPPTAARVLIAPGVGGDPRRAWGYARFRALADALRADGATVQWIAGPGDEPYFSDAPATESAATLRYGPQDLAPLAATLAEIDLLVCQDTAYVHLAAGVGVPTVAIYGAGQHARFHPAGGRVKIVQSRIACAGCQWHCLFDRLICVADIPLDAVLAAARNALRGDLAAAAVELPAPHADLPSRLQHEILALNADRFARLQIIQSLIAARDAEKKTPPAAEPRLSIIIPMGRPERVAATLGSLAVQQRLPAQWEIVLVGVAAEAVARAYPRFPIVPVALAANQLPPRTRCLGVERATGDWFLFLDDDVELAPDCLARFLAQAAAPETGRPLGALGPRLPGRTGRFFEQLTDTSNFWAQQTDAAEDRDWLYSAAIFVRADAYRRSGGFNPELPNGEDVDLTRRIAGAGYRLRYEPALVAFHDHRRDTLWTMWRYFWRNGNAARYFFAGFGAACPFSVKTAWLKSWSDLRMNADFHRAHGRRLGFRAVFVWLNYLIVESSLEWHWQAYIHAAGRYRALATKAKSDVTAVQAFTQWDEGRRFAGALRYALAVLQDFGNPVRR